MNNPWVSWCYSDLGWPRIPQVSNLQQLPISCGSIHLLDDKTLKDYILSSKISPDQAMSKIGSAPLRVKKNILEYRVYCIQNDRLGHTVPTKQTVNWSEFRGPRYHPKRAEIWWFGLVRLIQKWPIRWENWSERVLEKSALPLQTFLLTKLGARWMVYHAKTRKIGPPL